MKTTTGLIVAILGVAACSAPAWKSSFTEEELRVAFFNETKGNSDNCPFAELAGDKEAEVRAMCAADMEEMRQGFEFELIECTADLPEYTGLSGPDLRSAEVCLVRYQHIPSPRSIRARAEGEAIGRPVVGQLHVPSEVRRSWIIYRIDDQPVLHKYLN